MIGLFKEKIGDNLFTFEEDGQLENQVKISLKEIVNIAAKVCVSAGAMGIGLKLYGSFSIAFLTNTHVVLPIFPNVWDALFLSLSGAILTIYHISEIIPRSK
jgi:hypothetical protein